MIEQHELSVGAAVVWLRVPRGGYGYVFPVPAVVLAVGTERATIEVQRSDGTTLRRSVKFDYLRWPEKRGG